MIIINGYWNSFVKIKIRFHNLMDVAVVSHLHYN